MKKARIVLLFFILNTFCTAQFDRNWYFGIAAGLSFSTSPPTVLTMGQTNLPDNTSTISDTNGDLLFYTDGVSVWNKNHALMSNGSGLIGNYTAGQTALIVPVPCTSDKFVIFQNTEYSSPGQLHYSVVDMSLNGGLGNVVSNQKNISLGTGWTEKLCAIYNPNINSYWVLTHKWNSDQFVAFLVSSTSIATQSVISSVGSVHNCGSYSGTHDAMGQLTISRDGTKVLNALTCQDKFELFDFNLSTGALSNLITLPGNGFKAWGTAFSPDSKKIFTSTIFGQEILQYDITVPTSQAIVASQTTVALSGNSGYSFGYMELGPDNKLYIAHPAQQNLSVVNNPNSMGTASGFSLTGQTLGNSSSSHGISRIAYNIPLVAATPTLSVISSNTLLCRGSSATITATGANSYSWSSISLASSIVVSPNFNTVYTVTGNNGCSASTSTILITVTECTSVKNNIYSDEVQIYPAIVKDLLTIKSDKPLGEVFLYNTLGQECYAAKSMGIETLKLDLWHLSSGIYYIQWTGSEKTIKIIKQ